MTNQSQESLTDQLNELIDLANKNGLYDAADHIERLRSDNRALDILSREVSNARNQLVVQRDQWKDRAKHLEHRISALVDIVADLELELQQNGECK